MPAVLEPKKDPAAKYGSQVDEQLAQATSRIRAHDLAFGGLSLGAMTLLYATVMLLIDRSLALSEGVRQLALAGFLLAFAAAAYRLVVRPLSRQINPLYAAVQVEKTIEDAKNSVAGYVDAKDKEDVHPTVRAAMGARAANSVIRADLNRAIDHRSLVYAGGVGIVLLMTLVVLFFLFGLNQFKSILGRTFVPFTSDPIATRTQLQVTRPDPPDATVTSGQTVVLGVTVGGRIPNPAKPDRVRALIRHNPADPTYFELPLEQGESARDWQVRVPDHLVQNGFWYRIAGGDAETPEYHVTVRSLPMITDVDLEYRFPAYLNRKPQTTHNPRIEAVRGTRVIIVARANREVQDARLVIDYPADPDSGKPAESVTIAGAKVANRPDAVQFMLRVSARGTYRIIFTPTSGERNAEPFQDEIRVSPDDPPRVEIARPEEDPVTIPANGLLAVDGTIGDDYGVDRATLKMRVAGQPPVPLPDKPYLGGESFRRAKDNTWPTGMEYKDSVDFSKLVGVDGKPFPLAEGMVIEYWLEATDNRQDETDAGVKPTPQVGRSKVRQVRVGPPLTAKPEQEKQNQQKQDRKAAEERHAQTQQQKLDNENRNPDAQPNAAPDQNPGAPDQKTDPQQKQDDAKKGGNLPQNGQPEAKKDGQPDSKDGGMGMGNSTPMPKMEGIGEMPPPQKGMNQSGMPDSKPNDGMPPMPKGNPESQSKSEPGMGSPEQNPANAGGMPPPKTGGASGKNDRTQPEGAPPPSDPGAQNARDKADQLAKAIEKFERGGQPDPKTNPMTGQQEPKGGPEPKTGPMNPPEPKGGHEPKTGPMNPPEPKGGPEPKTGPQPNNPPKTGTGPQPPEPRKEGSTQPMTGTPQPEPKTNNSGSQPKSEPKKDGSTSPPMTGTGSQPPEPKKDGSGSQPMNGTGSQPMTEPKKDGTGMQPMTGGTGSQPPEPKKDGSGSQPMNGTGSQPMTEPKKDGSGAQPMNGTGNPPMPEPKKDGSGMQPMTGGMGKQPPEPKKDGSGSQPMTEPKKDGSGSQPMTEPKKDGSGMQPMPKQDGSGMPPTTQPKEDGSGTQARTSDGNPPPPQPKKDDGGGKPMTGAPMPNPKKDDRKEPDKKGPQSPFGNEGDGKNGPKKSDNGSYANPMSSGMEPKKDNNPMNPKGGTGADAGSAGENTPAPKEKTDPKQPPENGAGQKIDPKDVADAARDLKNPDPAKQQAARDKLDKTVGPVTRQELENAAQDLNSNDPNKRKVAEKKLDELAAKAAGDKKNPASPAAQKPKFDEKELANAVQDLNSPDPKKQQAARDKLDKSIGPDARKQVEEIAKGMNSQDPKERQAAQQKLEDLKKQAEAQAKKNQNSPDEQQPKLSPEEIAELAKKAGDLNSPDAKTRHAAEQEFDQKIGQDKRQELQKQLDEQLGDPEAKAQAAKEKLEQMANKGASGTPNPDGNKNPRGVGKMDPPTLEATKADLKNQLKTADFQLEKFEQHKNDKAFQNTTGWTQQEIDEAIKGQRRKIEELKGQLQEVENGGNPSSPTINANGGGKVDPRVNGTTGGPAGVGGPSVPPPGYSDRQKMFQQGVIKSNPKR